MNSGNTLAAQMSGVAPSGAQRRRGAAGSGWLRPRAVIMAAALLVLSATGALAQQSGGTYKYGHIHWVSEGNTVTFTIETVFKRSNPTAYFAGTALDGFAQIGDTITMTGRESPRFYFGDGTMIDVMRVKVTAYSAIEDWVMGDTVVTHTYSTPSDGIRPWLASFRGCCRWNQLENNGNDEWVLAAEVDLGKATMSPRARIMPVVSVPFSTSDGTLPKIKVPASDPANRNAVEWSLAKPWDVGNAAQFKRSQQSFISVPLQSDFGGNVAVPGFSSDTIMNDCTATAQSANSVSPGCLYRLLRTDKVLQALTVEGWVKVQTPTDSTAPGGYILSVGQDSGRSGFNTRCQNPDPTDRNWVNTCQISTLFIKANATHIAVGHDLDTAKDDSIDGSGQQVIANPRARMKEVGFAICSHPTVCADTGGSLVGKWVHVAVMRYQRGYPNPDTGATKWYHSYRVLVNGNVLEIEANPGGPRVPGEAMEYDPGESTRVEGPRGEQVPGTTCTCGSNTDWRCGCMEGPNGNNFASGTALIFGAYKGAAAAHSYFEGQLDEWRFWHGYRSPTEIVEEMNTKLRPELNDAYGNPADPAISVLPDPAGSTQKSLSRISTLMTLYNFDSKFSDYTTCAAAGLDYGCDITGLRPIFPAADDARIPSPGLALYKGYGSNVVSAPTDNTGKIFYSDGGQLTMDRGNITMSVPAPGNYQVMAMVSMPGGAGKVPVDFIVSVVDASWSTSAHRGSAYKLCTAAGVPCAYPGNQYMPSLKVAGHIFPGSDSCRAKASSAERSPSMTDLEQYLYPCMLVANTGYTVAFQLQGEDRQFPAVASQLELDYAGTNVGFGIGPLPPGARMSTVKGTNPSSADFSWVPCDEDIGMKTLCFEAIDRHANATTGASAPSVASSMKCVQIKVEADPPPYFVTGEGNTPSDTVTFTMGRRGDVNIVVADDNCLDQVRIEAGDGSGSKVLPAGATLTALDTSGAVCTEARSRMSWLPASKQGGFEEEVCFTAYDKGGSCNGMMPQRATYCINMVVTRCMYAVQMDEQLQDIATRFGMDWVRLWSLNPALLHPDYIVGMGVTIHVGHTYRADNSNSMPMDVARRMGMSETLIRDLNYGLDMSLPLQNGQEICVVPDSCKGMAGSVAAINFAANVVAQGADSIPMPAHQLPAAK